MKRAKSTAVKRPAAAADHPGLGPLKRPAKNSGTAALSRPPRREAVDSEEDCPLSGELQFYDSNSGRGSYQENAERVRSGNGLILVARNAEDRRPPIMFQYLQQALCCRHQIDGRSQKELTTIALASDHILRGNLERGLDVLAPRFKRIEAQATGVMDGPTAERLEITPRLEVSSLSPEEREEAVDLERRWQRCQRRDVRPSRSPSRTYN